LESGEHWSRGGIDDGRDNRSDRFLQRGDDRLRDAVDNRCQHGVVDRSYDRHDDGVHGHAHRTNDGSQDRWQRPLQDRSEHELSTPGGLSTLCRLHCFELHAWCANVSEGLRQA
jgi:hypothetical protein